MRACLGPTTYAKAINKSQFIAFVPSFGNSARGISLFLIILTSVFFVGVASPATVEVSTTALTPVTPGASAAGAAPVEVSTAALAPATPDAAAAVVASVFAAPIFAISTSCTVFLA